MYVCLFQTRMFFFLPLHGAVGGGDVFFYVVSLGDGVLLVKKENTLALSIYLNRSVLFISVIDYVLFKD